MRMPRMRRIQIPGAIYHIFARGNEKKNIFKSDDDYKKLLNIIKEAFGRSNFTIYAYALMPNHYHFLLKSHDVKIGKMMQFINTKYSSYFNWVHKRVGHLFQGRYKSIIVEKENYLVELVRYINLNPLRKNLVSRLSEYKWCSYNEYTGKRGFGITDTSEVLLWFGKDKKRSIKRFKAYLEEAKDISDKTIEDGLMGSLIHGSDAFVKQICGKLEKEGIKIPKKHIRGNCISKEQIVKLVAEEFKVKKTELLNKKGKYNYGKKYAIYLIWKNSDNTVYEIAKMFNNVHSSGIKRIVEQVEEEVRSNRKVSVIISKLYESLQK